MRDFLAFRKMISGVVIQVVFVLGLIAIVIAGVGAIANDQALVGLLLLVFGGLYWRIVCEVFIVLFRMNKSLEVIRANTVGLPSAFPPAAGTPAPASSLSQTASIETSDASAADAPAAAPAETATKPAAGWYADSERPGHKRWWDGTTWGRRDDEESSP